MGHTSHSHKGLPIARTTLLGHVMLLGLQLVFFNTYKHCANAVPAARLDLGRASNASHAGGNAHHCSSTVHKCTEHACTCAQNSEKKVKHSHGGSACYSCEPTHDEIAKQVKAFLPARGALAWRQNIDFVIPWSGPSASTSSRERDNGEMVYLLRSIAINAPWVHHVWLMVNGKVEPPSNIIPPGFNSRVTVIDRCSYMPEGTCPTMNSHAVELFAHNIPDLTEHFVIIEDDIFLGRPVTPEHLFSGDGGRPYVWRTAPTWGWFAGSTNGHRVYENPSAVGTMKTPLSVAPSPHYWYPFLKSVCLEVEKEFPAFYQFAGRHTSGRYFSRKAGGGGIDLVENSQEECPFGIYMHAHLAKNMGVFKNIDTKRHVWWDEVGWNPHVISEAVFVKAARDRPIFMNINDRFSAQPSVYKQQMAWFHSLMETTFPPLNIATLSTSEATALNSNSPKQQVMVYVHARKCAGSTVLSLFAHNGAKVNAEMEVWMSDPSSPAETSGVFTVLQEFDSFKLKQACDHCYISLGRDPIRRVVSLYHWRVYRKHIPRSMSLETYLSKVDSVGVHRDDQYHGFYSWAQQLCGVDPKCYQFNKDSEWILRRAKENVEKHFGLIGVVEHFDEFMRLGAYFFPSYFGDGNYVKTNTAGSAPGLVKANDAEYAVARGHYPATLLDLEMRFYHWALQRFQAMAARLPASFSTPHATDAWAPKTHYWMYGYTGHLPWSAVGSRAQSYDRFGSCQGNMRSPSCSKLPVPMIFEQLGDVRAAVHAQRDVPDGGLSGGFSCRIVDGFDSAPWFPAFRHALENVVPRKKPCGNHDEASSCGRWWHPAPQPFYACEPPRIWKTNLRETSHAPPACLFGQKKTPATRCAQAQRQLAGALNKLRVVWFLRSGSELGVVRGSSYLSKDGDMDIYVDMPTHVLGMKLQTMLVPTPRVSGTGITAEVHWSVAGCPESHLVYNDWTGDELQSRASPDDLCSCRMNSVELLCHRDGKRRMYTQYGPSWKVPLGLKQMDNPAWFSSHPDHEWSKQARGKLASMVDKTTGRIEADAVATGMPHGHEPENTELALTLAHLNICAKILGAVH